MLKLHKRMIAVLLTITMILSVIVVAPFTVNGAMSHENYVSTQSMSTNFKGGYTITGNGASDIVNIARAQNGRSKSQFGYTEDWCADFVSDCAKIAGQEIAVPFNGGVSYLYSAVLNAGGYTVSTPQTGDLIFYNNGGWCHVGIMLDSTYMISGNMWTDGYSKVETIKYTSYKYGNYSYAHFVRPKFSDGIANNDISAPNLSVDVSKGYANFSWNYQENIAHYDLKIWKGELWDGYIHYFEPNLNKDTTNCIANLTPGYYEAYIDATPVSGNVLMSNVVKFTILANSPTLTIDISEGNANFNWNYQDNIDHYDLKIWKDELWVGYVNHIEENISSNVTNKIVELKPGYYEGYIDAIDTNGNLLMSNVVKFNLVAQSPVLSVVTNEDSAEFTWNYQNNIDHYDLKIWNGTLWEGYVHYFDQNLSSNTTNRVVNLAAGYYEGYIDAVDISGNLAMSNIVKFKIDPYLKVITNQENSEVSICHNAVAGAESYYINIYNAVSNDLVMKISSNPDEISKIKLTNGSYHVLLTTDNNVSSEKEYFSIDVLYGDANGDGEVNIQDATLVQMFVAKYKVDNFNEKLADCDQSGAVNIQDATAIQMKVAKLA